MVREAMSSIHPNATAPYMSPQPRYIPSRRNFSGACRIGFRNVHIFIHHQSENFTDGMPTDLAFKLGAREAIFEFLEKTRGENWWGDSSMQDYYMDSTVNDNPFNWIRIHPFMDGDCQKEFPIDHAGKQETSLMMAFCPEGVDMKRFTDKKWYARAAKQANPKYGARAKKMIMDGIRKALKG